MIGKHAKTRLRNIISIDNLKPVNFLYYVIFVAVPLALVAFLAQSGYIIFYAGMIVVSAAIIFVIKSFTSGISDIKLDYKPWFLGLLFSVLATLVVSVIAHMPVPIPVMNASEYRRANTLRGMKKGEIHNKDKWEASMFSFLAILAFAQLFLAFSSTSKNSPIFYSAVLLIAYVIVEMLPMRMFNGAFMAYHNSIFYFISASFIVLMFLFAYIDRSAELVLFIIFLIISLISYKIKLW